MWKGSLSLILGTISGENVLEILEKIPLHSADSVELMHFNKFVNYVAVKSKFQNFYGSKSLITFSVNWSLLWWDFTV